MAKYLKNITQRPDKEIIYLRLGYKKGKTQIDNTQKEKIEKIIDRGFFLCSLEVVYNIFDIEELTDEYIKLKNGILFKSKNLVKWLNNPEKIILMASTVGKKIVEERDKAVKENNGLEALVLDAVASETADFGLDWLEKYIINFLKRENKTLTRRYSAGYGDLDLSAQKDIYDALHLENLDISITDNYILIPEKSVLAISGIK